MAVSGVNELIHRWISSDRQHSDPDDVRIVDYGVSVWAVIGYLPAVHGKVDRAAHDFGIPVDAVVAAVAYYDQNRDVIDERIAANVSHN